jgi:hypothetical protein
MTPAAAVPPFADLERAWTINEALHQLLTQTHGPDWRRIARVADELAGLARASAAADQPVVENP